MGTQSTPKTQITDMGCPEAGSKTLMRWWCKAGLVPGAALAGQGAEELSEPPSTPQPRREQRAAGLELLHPGAALCPGKLGCRKHVSDGNYGYLGF